MADAVGFIVSLIHQRRIWLAQIEAIAGLEKSFAKGLLRALIQLATGSGKTFTAVNFIYRLVKYAGARRVLFLVDQGNQRSGIPGVEDHRDV